jgi:hypothetical protein
MRYLIHNGQRVIVNSKYITAEEIIQALNFDGSTYISFSDRLISPEIPEFKVSFYLYLDDDYYSSEKIILMSSDTVDPNEPTENLLHIFLSGEFLHIQTGTPSSKINIEGLNNQAIFVEITIDKDQLSQPIVKTVEFNGISKDLEEGDLFYDPVDRFDIGVYFDEEEISGILDRATIWDLKYHTSNWIKGYPGDQNISWNDQIGTLEGTITTDPPEHLSDIGTREIKF